VSKHVGKRFVVVTIQKRSCTLPYGLFLLLTSNLQGLKQKSFSFVAHDKAPMKNNVFYTLRINFIIG